MFHSFPQWNESALMDAVRHNHFSIAYFLIANGADVNMKNKVTENLGVVYSW
jgi:hypothetical protein